MQVVFTLYSVFDAHSHVKQHLWPSLGAPHRLLARHFSFLSRKPCGHYYDAQRAHKPIICTRQQLCCTLQGVPPGKYEVCWRTQKLAHGIGIASSEVNMTAKAHRVHPADPNEPEDDSLTKHPLRAFESDLPTGVWMDVSGGQVTIKEFCNIDARLWCHSGEWKQHLAWDYVQLVDLNAHPSVSPGQKSILAASANAANKVATFAQDFWSRVSRWPSRWPS